MKTQTNNSNNVTLSAYSEDYSDKSYKFYFGNNNFEFVPKSQVEFLESEKTGENFGEGIQSRYFSIPKWLVYKLKGVEFYGI